MQPYRIIDCHVHDHLELACIRGYQLLIETSTGEIRATAITLTTKADKSEYLTVRNEAGEQAIRLDHIQAITPLTQGAAFDRVVIAPADKSRED
ncbi:Rho-binding antiterminator [Shewanella halotolerans]|uniref:Rho-binding antiterminator n=1 Tax=Shewanella halotolerans TaxID=2864204 RepID=UPI001C65AFB7|nr:Rho-binding antiterminator [Shewanella halotolerans]QYJ90286.1 Rho-binding antiterminator [Shewanella halotolerans]